MKHITFKHALLTVSLAVISGVLLLGVQVAIGAPSVAPAGNGVSPTFTGLDVTGDASVIKDFILTGSIKSPNAQKGTLQTMTVSIPPVKVFGDLQLNDTGNIDVKGNIYNSKTGEVRVFGNFLGLGDVTANKNMFTQNLTATNAIEAKGSMWNYGELSVKGSTVFGFDGQDGNVEINSSLDATPALDNVPFYVHNTTTGKGIGIDSNEIMSKGDDLWLNWDSGKNVNIGGASNGGKKANLTVDGDFKVTGEFTKAIKQTQSKSVIGDYALIANCPTATPHLMSCSLYFDKPQFVSGGSLPIGGNCLGSYYQNSATAVSATVTAICY